MSMLGLRDLVLITPTPSSLHHHHHQGQPISSDHTNNNSSNLSVGFGIFPLLTATPCVPQHHHTTTTTNNNNVQDHCGGTTTTTTTTTTTNTNTNSNNNYWNLKMCPEVMLMNPASARKQGVVVDEDDNDNDNDNDDDDEGHNNRAVNAVMMESEEDEHGGELRVCQDCGNRAKKECLYRRCRTCCKGRGYDCNTHVRSTWVPAIRRRERQMAVPVPVPATAANKRQRALGLSHNNVTPTSHSSNSNATTPKSFDSTSSHQDAGFKQSLPGHVRAPAVFRCHRVSSIGNSENEFAYLATVHISGHVFKGFLYDHGVGVEGKINAMPCAASSELQLGNNSSRGKNKECSYPIGVPTNNAYSASAT